MAIGWAAAYHFLDSIGPAANEALIFFGSMAAFGTFFNILLMVFNLVPILPLDGGRALRGLVPETLGNKMDALEPYGLIILVGLLMAGILNPIVGVVVRLTAFLGVSL